MLYFTHFEKSYDTTPVISIPEFVLQDGIYWLQGENGSGKTTLLKSIAGLIPFKGTIRIHDVDIRKHRIQYRKWVNWADAEPVYPDFLTGSDLISFYQQTINADTKKLNQIINSFGVNQFAHHKIGTYSSGMTKKLSLVLAFMGHPKWILLDEPLITLDTKAVDSCLSLIHSYNQQGVSFLITSHQSFLDAGLFNTQILRIENKKLVQL